MEQRQHLVNLFKEVAAKVVPYLEDAHVNEILVNPDGKLWVDSFKDGRVFTGNTLSASERKSIICLIAGMGDKAVTELSPDVAIELAYTGERFQGLLPPIVDSPAFSIRKHIASTLSFDDYVKAGSLTERQKVILTQAVADRLNIIACGPTSSGKTTFANAMLLEVAKHQQRVLILEDTKELQCAAEDVVQLKTSSTRSMRDLIKASLRLRPDRIIVGEVRGGEALELLKAWGTGHPGGIATLHADSALDCLYRLEDLVAESTQSPQNRLISSSVDMVVYMERENNQRVVKEIVKVNGLIRKENTYEVESVH